MLDPLQSNETETRRQMARTDTVGQATYPHHWRTLIEKYLDQLLDISQCEYAAFVDMSMDRERYVFATRQSPLPDINWRGIIRLLSGYQQSNSGYLIITRERIINEPDFNTLAEHFESGLFDIVLCVPLIEKTELLGTSIIFGNVPPVDLSALSGSDRSRMEGLAELTACSLASYAEKIESNGRGNIHDAVLRKLPEGLLVTDSEGVIIEVNDAFSALTGIQPDSLIGHNLKEHPILGTDCDDLVARLHESGQPFEIVARLDSGEQVVDDPMFYDEESINGKFLRLRGCVYSAESDIAWGMLLLADDVTGDVFEKMKANHREHRHSQEIDLASRLQQNYFPSNYQKKRIRISTRLIAADELSGDFFDIFDLGPNTICLVIGDVVGKGIPSSLMAMSVHSMIGNQAGALTPPMKVLERVNEGLYHQVKGEYWYATCFYAKIHATQLRMTYSRAGHELPLWWHKDSGEVTYLEGEGLPLGIFPDSRYTTLQADLNEGDRLLFYTDGLTDAINPAGERFGHDRLVELFRRNSSLSTKNLLKVIENDVLKFNGGRELVDDIALALVSIVPDSWMTLTVPPYTFTEVLESLLDELKLKGIDEDTIFKVRLSLDECVVNAFRHGHQGDERRPIIVSYLIEPERITMKVRDQGPGFDFGMIPDPTLDENLLQPGGRGVFLTLKMMDEVSFNDVGNEVTMIKYLHS